MNLKEMASRLASGKNETINHDGVVIPLNYICTPISSLKGFWEWP